jgi:hypothetical protein
MMELGLERWERWAPLDQLGKVCGPDRRIYAVTSDGRLRMMELAQIREFLLGCAFHENYFLLAPPLRVEERVADLLAP